MSIHHTVTVHCDECGHWSHAEGRDLTKHGWLRYRNGDEGFPEVGGYLGSVCHLCPRCAALKSHDSGSAL